MGGIRQTRYDSRLRYLAMQAVAYCLHGMLMEEAVENQRRFLAGEAQDA